GKLRADGPVCEAQPLLWETLAQLHPGTLVATLSHECDYSGGDCGIKLALRRPDDGRHEDWPVEKFWSAPLAKPSERASWLAALDKLKPPPSQEEGSRRMFSGSIPAIEVESYGAWQAPEISAANLTQCRESEPTGRSVVIEVAADGQLARCEEE